MGAVSQLASRSPSGLMGTPDKFGIYGNWHDLSYARPPSDSKGLDVATLLEESRF